MMKIIWMDSSGWPVEFVKGRPAMNFFRWIFLAGLWETWTGRNKWVRTPGGGLVRKTGSLLE